MKNQSIILWCFAMFITSDIAAQIYFGNANSSSHTGLGRIDLEQCNFESFNISKRFTDITLHPNGKFYGLSGVNNKCAIVEIDVKEKRISDTIFVLASTFCSFLTCDKDGTFYFGLYDVLSYNPETGIYIEYGNLQTSYPLGDIVFYKNELIGGTTELTFNSANDGELIRIDLENIENSEVIFDFNGTGILCYGLAVLGDDCNQPQLILNFYTDNFIGEDTIFLLNIDLENNTYSTLCQKITNNFIAGLASEDELRTNCELQLDLDQDNSSGRFIDHFETELLCVTHYPIADEDVTIRHSGLYIDSMVVEVKVGLADEFLIGAANETLLMEGPNSRKLVFYNMGMATDADFIAAVQSIRFVVENPQALEGEREIRLRLYAGDSVSDAARAFIEVNKTIPTAGEDGTLDICYGAGVPFLFETLEGNPYPGGHWTPALHSGTDFFSLALDTAGIYTYTIAVGSCRDTAQVTVRRLPQPEIDLMTDALGNIDLCQGDSIVWDVTIPHPLSYEWLSGSTEPIRVVDEPGHYVVQVIDVNHCFTIGEAYVHLLPNSSITVTEQISLCAGESWDWQGEFFTTDTTLCQVFPRANGCDSTYCRVITFRSLSEHIEMVKICGETSYEWQGQTFVRDTFLCIAFTDHVGCDSMECLDLQLSPAYQSLESHVFVCGEESYMVEGISFTQDTTFCLNDVSAAGCDSIRCLEAEIIPPLPFFSEAAICEGEAYVWEVNGDVLTATGEYTYIKVGENDCDSTFKLNLMVFPHQEIRIDTSIEAGEVIMIGDETFSETGEYQVLLLDENNCDSTIFLSLDVLTSVVDYSNSTFCYHTPTLINPNGRLWNSSFMVYHSGAIPATIKALEIFDILGRRIFKMENVPTGQKDSGWKGEQHGQPMPNGIYFYQALIIDHQGAVEKLTGSVVLMR